MIRNDKFVATAVETIGRCRRVVAITFALGILLPAGASAMDSTPKVTSDRAGHALSLPSIRYIDSMRWMDWKPSAPVFKVDTLLLPDSTQPGVFRLPSDYEPDLPRVS
jgi:hypothetical protein